MGGIVPCGPSILLGSIGREELLFTLLSYSWWISMALFCIYLSRSSSGGVRGTLPSLVMKAVLNSSIYLSSLTSSPLIFGTTSSPG